jgi:hypothetical protein
VPDSAIAAMVWWSTLKAELYHAVLSRLHSILSPFAMPPAASIGSDVLGLMAKHVAGKRVPDLLLRY